MREERDAVGHSYARKRVGKMDKSAVLLFLALISISSVFALAASMGNVRRVLYPDIYPNETTILNKTIKVNNINDREISILLETQGNFSDYIKILDPEFSLAPNTSKDARFQIILNKSGRYEGKIFVTFNPGGNDLNSSPVGLASNIIIFAKNSTKPVENISLENKTSVKTGNAGNSSLHVLLALLIVILVGVGVYVMRGKK